MLSVARLILHIQNHDFWFYKTREKTYPYLVGPESRASYFKAKKGLDQAVVVL